MKLAIFHSTPLLDASLSSATVSWLVVGLVAWLVIIVVGVLVTAPARRQSRAAALVKPAETLAPDSPPPAPEPLPTVPMPEPEEPTALPINEAPEAVAPEMAAPDAVQPEAAPAAAESTVAAPEPRVSEQPPAAFEPVHEATDTATEAATAAEPAQPAAPIPTSPDFSVSGPIMLPNSVVSATFGSATETVSPATGPIIPPAIDVPGRESAISSSAPASGPLMPPPAPEPEPAAPPVPFVVAPIAPAEPVTPASAPSSAPSSANGATYSERVPLPTAVDLFAHSYGRSNAAMLSATERAAASRIVRALGDDPLAVQLAGMYAAETHRSLDGLAQLLETDRRNRIEHDGKLDALSDADALDVFAHSYGRTNAAMLGATERAAASRIVRALGDDPLAVRLAGQYAADTHRALDRLANRLETDLRRTRGHNGHFGQYDGHQSSTENATSSEQ